MVALSFAFSCALVGLKVVGKEAHADVAGENFHSRASPEFEPADFELNNPPGTSIDYVPVSELRKDVLRRLFGERSPEVMLDLTDALDQVNDEAWDELEDLLDGRRLEDVLRGRQIAGLREIIAELAERSDDGLDADVQAAIEDLEGVHPDIRSAVEALKELQLRNDVHRILYGDLPPSIASPLSEVLDRMSEDDWTKLAKVLGGRRLEDVLRPREVGSAIQPGPRRRRWAGRAHVDLPIVDASEPTRSVETGEPSAS